MGIIEKILDLADIYADESAHNRGDPGEARETLRTYLQSGAVLPEDVVLAVRLPLTTSETSAALMAIDGGVIVDSGASDLIFVKRGAK